MSAGRGTRSQVWSCDAHAPLPAPADSVGGEATNSNGDGDNASVMTLTTNTEAERLYSNLGSLEFVFRLMDKDWCVHFFFFSLLF